MTEPIKKKSFISKPTYTKTYFCKNCKKKSTFDVVKGVEIIDQKDGVIFIKGYDGELKQLECKSCGKSNYLFEN